MARTISDRLDVLKVEDGEYLREFDVVVSHEWMASPLAGNRHVVVREAASRIVLSRGYEEEVDAIHEARAAIREGLMSGVFRVA